MMDEKFKSNQWFIVAVIVILQISVFVYFGTLKLDFHIDEIYSYFFSNSYYADKFGNASWMWDNWITGSDFMKFVTVQNGEQFAYDKVYLNNSTDCHPPLFYWLLHTICSFFPDVFSKWFGIGLNIFIYLGYVILIQLISNELIEDKLFRLLPLLTYGFSLYAIDIVMFVRMYMLLGLFTLASVYFSIRMYKYGFSTIRIVAVWLMIFLGGMTHYYSFVFNFWGVLLACMYLLKHQRIKTMFIFGIGAFISVLAVVVANPFVITQATGSSTNNVGNEVAANLFNFSLWFRMTSSLAKSFVYGLSNYYLVSIILFLVVGVLFVLFYYMNKKHHVECHVSNEHIWLIMTIIMTYLSITFIGGHYVSLRYIYHIIPVTYISVIALFGLLLRDVDLHFYKKFFVMGCLFFVVFNSLFGIIKKNCNYLFLGNYKNKKLLSEYTHIPCMVITNDKRYTAIATGSLTILSQFDKVYMGTLSDFKKSNVIQKYFQNNKSCICYILTGKYFDLIKGVDPTFVFSNEFPKGIRTRFVANGIFGRYYLVEKAD